MWTFSTLGESPACNCLDAPTLTRRHAVQSHTMLKTCKHKKGGGQCILIHEPINQLMLSPATCECKLAGVLLPQRRHISEAAAAAVGKVCCPQAQERGCAGRVRQGCTQQVNPAPLPPPPHKAALVDCCTEIHTLQKSTPYGGSHLDTQGDG